MKNHIYRLNLCIHSIKIHVSFPCTVGACLQLENQQIQITDNIDIKQSHQSINATIQSQISILYNQRTNIYSMKKANISFFLRTKTGKLQAGATTLFLNKMISGCTKEITPISKCSDRQAIVEYSLNLQLLEQAETTMTASMMKGSTASDNNAMKNSAHTKRMFQHTNLYESIVQQVDEKHQKPNQTWQKNSNHSRSRQATNRSYISSDLKHNQSHKGLSTWRVNTDGNNIRKSRYDGSVEVDNRQGRKTNLYGSNAGQNNHLSASKASNVQIQQVAEDTRKVLERKIQQSQRENKQLREQINSLKKKLNSLKQRLQQQLSTQKNILRKSQMTQSALRQQLQSSRHKLSLLQQQSSKLLFQKNQLLNKYNSSSKDQDTLLQLKSRQKLLTNDNKKLNERLEKMQRLLNEQQEKAKGLESKNKQQEKDYNRKIKQYQYYQQEVVDLDEKLGQQKHVEEQLRNQLQRIKDQLAISQDKVNKQLQKNKKQLQQTKQLSSLQSRNLMKDLQSLKSKFQQKQSQIQRFKSQLQKQKRSSTKQSQSLSTDLLRLNRQLKKLSQQKQNQQQKVLVLKDNNLLLEDKLRNLREQIQQKGRNMENDVRELQNKLDQLNLQEFRLNQHNFQLQQQINKLQNQIHLKNQQFQQISHQLNFLNSNLHQKQINYQNLTQQVQQKTQLLKNHQQRLKHLEQKIQQLQSQQISISHDNQELNSLLDDIEMKSELKISELQKQVSKLIQNSNKKSIQYNEKVFTIQSLTKELQTLKNKISSIQQTNKKMVNQLIQKGQIITQMNQNIFNKKKYDQQQKQKIHQQKQLITEQIRDIQLFIHEFQLIWQKIVNKDFKNVTSISNQKSNYKYGANNKNNQPTNQIDYKALICNKKSITFADNLISKLQEMQKYLTKQNQQFKTQREQVRVQIEILRQQNSNLSNQLEMKGSQIQLISKQLILLNNEKSSLSQQILKLKSQTSNSLQLSKQMQQQKKQLISLKKQLQSKQNQVTKLSYSLLQSNKKLQSMTLSNKDSIEKLQKVSQELIGKNKLINELQNSFKLKTTQLSKVKITQNQLQEYNIKLKKQKEQITKSIVIQQQANSKNNILVKQLRQSITKKEQILKQTQRQLKLMEGQLFQQKKLKNIQNQKQGNNFSYTTSYGSNKKPQSNMNQSISSSRLTYAAKRFLPTVTNQQSQNKLINELENQIVTLKKQLQSKKTIQKWSKKPQNIKQHSPQQTQLAQSILNNLQLIQKHISSTAFQTGGKYQKHKVQLVGLINRNRKVIIDSNRFQEIKHVATLLLKLRNNIMTKYKIDYQIKTLITQEIKQITTTIDQIKN